MKNKDVGFLYATIEFLPSIAYILLLKNTERGVPFENS